MEIRIGRDVRTHLVHLLANTFSSGSLYLKFYIETYYIKVRNLEHGEEALRARALPTWPSEVKRS